MSGSGRSGSTLSKNIKKIQEIDEFFNEWLPKTLVSIDRSGHTISLLLAYHSLIDLLSQYRFGESHKVGDKIRRLVCLCKSWPHWDLISLPVLLENLKQVNKLPAVRRTLEKAISHRMKSGRLLGVHEADLTLHELRNHEPKIAPDIDSNLRHLEQTRHLVLFWKHRNYIIHQFRGPGRGWHFGSSKMPYYQGHIDLPNGQERWELFYPPAFVRQILLECAEIVHAWALVVNRSVVDALPKNSTWGVEREWKNWK